MNINFSISWKTILFSLFFINQLFSQDYQVLESDDNHIILEFNFNNKFNITDTLINGIQFSLIKDSQFPLQEPDKPFLPTRYYEIGLPPNSDAQVFILENDREVLTNKFILPVPDSANQPLEKLNYDQDIYGSNSFYPLESALINSQSIYRYIKIADILISPFQFNPVERTLVYNKRIKIRIDYKKDNSQISVLKDKASENFVKSNLINYSQALNFIGELKASLFKSVETYWYNPNKEYYKIYLNTEGVYRLTFDYFNSHGIPVQNVLLDKIEIFNNGVEIPIYVYDANNNNTFDAEDYCEFVGVPVKASSSYSSQNIYNTKNVYWLSFKADGTGLRYTNKDGYPNSWEKSFYTIPYTMHYEVDSLYERLGHASDDKRDYWFWGKTSGLNGELLNLFTTSFPGLENINSDSTAVNVSVNVHGMTTISCLDPDHKIKLYITSQLIGEFTFDGPTSATLKTSVDLNKVNFFPINNFQVAAYGDIAPNPCDPSSSRYDEIRVNWFEIEYPRNLRANQNNIIFQSPPGVLGNVRFQVDNWLRDDVKIFSPQKNEMIINPNITHSQYNDFLFVDNLSERTKYYCIADDYYLIPDSIKNNSNSNLRNTTNGADYIIISHSKFLSAAERLKNFRLINFPDTSIVNPRIEIVNIDDIYNEFSYGLLDPYAIKSFISYAFTNWQTPSPAYVVLLGDMSYDYRSLVPGSRPNFIPSIPYHARTYGQAASDNSFVTVKGTDYKPDLAIGRLSCETIDEANVLVDKIISYPDDTGKKWKQNVMLISSGLNQDDENLMGFNEGNLNLDNTYLIPNGIASNKIFRYPNPAYPEQAQYKGEGPEIRTGFNEGAVLANYYGHGGGYQWDLVFNNDDIYQLENEGRLPFISSVTCYTAHFDNQDVFGEQFNKVPGKGSIGFFGSSGLTYWFIGKYFNELLFGQIFNSGNKIIGRAIENAKNILPEGGYYSDQVSLLTLLGDPLLDLALPDKPDFSIVAGDIEFIPFTPIMNDTINVSVKINNYGRVFPNDTLIVQVHISLNDTSYFLPAKYLPSFGEENTVVFKWIPSEAGLYTFTVKLNADNRISEDDYTDDETSVYVTVYDLSSPNIIKPLDGDVISTSSIEFLFADKGDYLDKDLKYIIEIDTNILFQSPIIKSGSISPSKGILTWNSPQLNDGNYFWHTRIFAEADSSNWSETFAIKIDKANTKNGYLISENHLNLFNTTNVLYSSTDKSLFLNSNLLPPRPANDKLLQDITFTLPSDIGSISAITNDGSYIYFGHMAYYSGTSKIYKLGTGYNGTISGQLYGAIPNITLPIWHTMFYYKGFIYVATGNAYKLVRVDPASGDTTSVSIPNGLLNSIDSQVHNGAFYLSSDGRYIYNVAYITSDGINKYTVRIIDPENNWQVVKDVIPTDRSFDNFCGFFVADGYFYPYENYQEGYLRRINLETGFYEEEWISFLPFQGFYAWTYDSENDIVYASVFSSTHTPKISKFIGKYRNTFGTITSTSIGPASKWNSVEYVMDTEGATGNYNAVLQGFNKNTSKWDTLITSLPAQLIPSINIDTYKFIRLSFMLVDSSFGETKPIELKSVHVDYTPPPEIMISKDNISFSPDSILQGYDVIVNTGIQNISSIDADSVQLDYYQKAVDFSSADVFLKSRLLNLEANSQQTFTDTIHTTHLLLNNQIKLVASYPKSDMFSFNNTYQKSFYVKRDSERPIFDITFDGKEIISNDIISSQPTIQITLEDNSPLPLNPNDISITHFFDNVQEVIKIPSANTSFEYAPYPNSKAIVTWKPAFEDGNHTLIVTAKDSSNNYFDSTSYNIDFNVYSNPDLRDVYNYPNPFSNNTYFTFEIRGITPPEEFKIKIFTVAGRLIKEFNISQSELRIGFNKIPWDGRDEDGDEIANGLYFYKVISKQNNEVMTVTQKLAKVK
ncbi:MAG: C25 family cysteine peptidase [Ignavibacteriaceae bacterium]